MLTWPWSDFMQNTKLLCVSCNYAREVGWHQVHPSHSIMYDSQISTKPQHRRPNLPIKPKLGLIGKFPFCNKTCNDWMIVAPAPNLFTCYAMCSAKLSLRALAVLQFPFRTYRPKYIRGDQCFFCSSWRILVFWSECPAWSFCCFVELVSPLWVISYPYL